MGQHRTLQGCLPHWTRLDWHFRLEPAIFHQPVIKNLSSLQIHHSTFNHLFLAVHIHIFHVNIAKNPKRIQQPTSSVTKDQLLRFALTKVFQLVVKIQAILGWPPFMTQRKHGGTILLTSKAVAAREVIWSPSYQRS